MLQVKKSVFIATVFKGALVFLLKTSPNLYQGGRKLVNFVKGSAISVPVDADLQLLHFAVQTKAL